eukprot:CCRYP_010330-RA/>CCRYP_010330-RA protein AED:0.37 eAED:0.37 QI:0/0/0/1/1/1/2/0/416
MVHKRIPKQVSDYGLKHVASLMQLIPRPRKGRTGYEEVFGKTPDISEYCDFEFWDLVWFHKTSHPGLGEEIRALGRFAGVSHRVGRDMCYWIMPVSGIPISDTTVQHVTTEDLLNPDIKSQVDKFNEKLVAWIDDTNHRVKWDLLKSLDDLIFDDPAYGDGSNTPTDKECGYTPGEEVDDSDLNSYGKFIGAKIRLTDDENNGGNIATVKKRATDFSGKPLGKPHDNPMLDSRIYEVELEDGTVDRYCANQIAEYIWAQVNSEGREHLVMHELVDHQKNCRAIPIERGYTIDCHCVKRPKITLDGWEVLMGWKEGSTSWLGFTPTRVDSKVYCQKAMKDDGTYYYELMLLYVDDVLLLSNDPKLIFEKISGTFSLKNDARGPPTQYLGAKIEKFYFPDGTFAWSMSSNQMLLALWK